MAGMAEPSLLNPESGAAASSQSPATGPRLDPVVQAVAEVRADPLRKFYPNVNQYSAEAARDYFASVEPLATGAALDKRTIELQHMARDMGATPDEYGTLLSEAKAIQSKQLTPDDRAAMRREATTALRAKYGEDTSRVFRLANTLARRDPRLVKLLESSGAGDSPRVALALAEMGLRAAKRGELKG